MASPSAIGLLSATLFQSSLALSAPPNPYSVSQTSTISASAASSSAAKNSRGLKLKRCSSRASAQEGVPSELDEESKFVPLNADDSAYGPPVLLLLGFEVEEDGKIRQFLRDLDGEFLEIVYCTEDMIDRSLWEAVHTRQPNLEAVKVAQSLPRICIFSGLTGEEIMMFIDAFPEAGFEPAVFAAMVPNSAYKPLQELIDEIMGDHEMLSAKQSSSNEV